MPNQTFPTDLSSIQQHLQQIDPLNYGKTRNYTDGAVTRLSPYISRGVLSTKQVMEHVLAQGHKPWQVQKFMQELAWRDYWQRIWQEKDIDQDLKREQPEVSNQGIAEALLNAATGIEAIDAAIEELYQTGYMHNHLRMYVAAIALNMAHSHWKTPAHWLYYHLLDGDWASNALSWQWVGGSNSHKKYVANQGNINKFTYSEQKGTFIDVPYAKFNEWQVPEVLQQIVQPELVTPLPAAAEPSIDPQKPTVLYTYYNLDPHWLQELDANRVLLLEPSVFKKYPVSQKCIDFALGLGNNISGLQICVAEFADFAANYPSAELHYKEHPLCRHFSGTEHPRDWMFPEITGYFPSFFSYWKKCQKSAKEQE